MSTQNLFINREKGRQALRIKKITETFFKKGKIVRRQVMRECESFDAAADGLQYGTVAETELEDGGVVVTRTESFLAEQE